MLKQKSQQLDEIKDTIRGLENQIQMLKIELENEKNKTVKFQIYLMIQVKFLRTGLAQALLDKKDKNKLELKTTDKKKLKMSLGKSKVDVKLWM